MSFLNITTVQLRCDLALNDYECRGSVNAANNETAEAQALAMGWVKRGWKHYCPECVRRQAIEKQKETR